MRGADELVDSIVRSSQIPSGKRRFELHRELRSHIDDFVVAAREAGCDQNEIEKLVLANFGDPAQIAQGFAWVYRHDRRRLRAVVYTLSTVLLASCLFAAILVMQAGLAFSFGTSIMSVFAGRHTVIEALDILASVAAYSGVASLEELFHSHRFQRATFLVTAIFTILMVVCTIAGLYPAFLVFGLLNGIFFRAVRVFVTRASARVAIIGICFPLAGVVLTLLWSPVSHFPLLSTCASWLFMGAGYLLMIDLAPRVDSALLNGFQRIQTDY
jgi:hypothetical protein